LRSLRSGRLERPLAFSNQSKILQFGIERSSAFSISQSVPPSQGAQIPKSNPKSKIQNPKWLNPPIQSKIQNPKSKIQNGTGISFAETAAVRTALPSGV